MRLAVEVRVRRPAGFTLDASHACEAQAVGIVGPSGSGKSTFLDAVAGIEAGARVVVDGEDCSSLPLHRRRMGYVTQDPLLFPHLTVRKNLGYSPAAGPVEATARALGVAHLLDRMPRNLSGGERRRVALARAILGRPRVLLLDEPFGGLDETRRREAMSLLAQVHRDFRIPMILVSHSAEEVIGLTDWVVRLEKGKITASGPTLSVLRAREARIDNYLTGAITGPGRVRVGGMELAAMLPEDARGRVRLACYADDILLANRRPEGISARNVLPARVRSVTPLEDAALIDLEPLGLRAILTADAVGSLGLKAGVEAYAIVKAASIVCLGPA
ncbi:MAG: ATP-binding cassette domain-containing protein [Acidobacteria bacterium]|nr:ATP-binding cassette domain-containing protein [Acidobacteriota bacterium]